MMDYLLALHPTDGLRRLLDSSSDCADGEVDKLRDNFAEVFCLGLLS